MTESASPLMLAAALAAAGLFFLVLIERVSSRPDPHAQLLKANVWVIALSGCALSVIHREAPESEFHPAILLGGTAVVCVIFLIAFTSARGASRGPHGEIVALAWVYTMVELTYLAFSQAPLQDHLEIVAALFFFPGVVTQIWLSGSSTEQLLTLAYRLTRLVTVGSLVFGAVRPLLAVGDAPTDMRRFPIGPLVHRLSGLTPHPNYLSVTAVFCLLLALQLKVRHRIVVSVLCIGAILAAESRTAAASLVVAVFVLWVVKSRRPLARFIVTAPFVLIGLVWSGAFISDLESEPLGSDIATNGRFRIWDAVLQTFMQDPWTGYGPLAFQPDSQSPYFAVGLLHAHNLVLEGVAEAGLVGGVLTALLLVAVIRIGVANRSMGIYPASAAVVLANCATEPFMTMHLYGLNYAVVLPTVIWIVAMSAPLGKSSERRRTKARASRINADPGPTSESIQTA